MSFPQYPEYQESGYDWIGQVPIDWATILLKHGFAIEGGSTPPPDKANWDGQIIWVTPADLSNLDSLFVGDSARKITTTGLASCGTKLLPPDTIILSTRAPIGSLAISMATMCTNQGCKGLVPRKFISSTYYAYVLLVAKDQLNVRGKGTTFLEISSDELGRFAIPKPSYDEQLYISRFLDHETAKIDALIAEQQRLIELLKEKRQAVISHAVTKGLNPNAPMKDSGVEWLGEVPAHWRCMSYRYATRIIRGKFGHRPRNDPALYDGDFPFIQTGDVARASKYITEYKQTLNDRGASVSAEFPAGTLVMAIAANIGDTAILQFDAYAPDSVVGFNPSFGINLEYLQYSLDSSIQALEQTSTQSTQANLNIDRVGGVKAAFPPEREQEEIVKYLDNICDQFSGLMSDMESSIGLMMERRSALISAAVTGKIDVRNWRADPECSVPMPMAAEESVKYG